MGLAIFLHADNQETLRAALPDFPSAIEFLRLYGLSRTFCNFMWREAWGSPTELDQLGALTGLDIQPLYEMRDLEDTEGAWEHLRGNIDRVQATVEALLSQLASYDDLAAHLDSGLQDTLHNKVYFANFLQEADSGPTAYYNFGQDLRTIQRFLAFARTYNSHTVYFWFG